MNSLFDTFEHWLQGQINACVQGLLSRVERLEATASTNDQSLAKRVRRLEDDFVSASRVEDLVQEALNVADWNELIGSEIDERIDTKLEDFDQVIKDKIDDELSDLEVSIHRS